MVFPIISMSFAYAGSSFGLFTVINSVLSSAVSIIFSRIILKKRDDSASLCFRSLSTSNGSYSWLSIHTLNLLFFTHILTRWVNFFGIESPAIAFHSWFLLMLSYACRKAMKRLWIVFLNSHPFSSKTASR